MRFIGRGNLRVRAGTSDFEAWILAVLAKQAKRMFEVGTGSGKTAYLLARNAPDDGKVTTLTLRSEETNLSKYETGNDFKASATAREQAAFSEFLYSGTEVEPKIHQLFCDSKAFDEMPYVEQFDLIFVDGNHTYSYVRSDTEKALQMLRAGGTILWHDYRGPRIVKGTWRYLNELARELPLFHIADTSLVAYTANRSDEGAATAHLFLKPARIVGRECYRGF